MIVEGMNGLLFPSHYTPHHITTSSSNQVWRHPQTDATISRCSQPMPGIGNKLCQSDVYMVSSLRTANRGNKAVVHILDARPLKSALGDL